MRYRPSGQADLYAHAETLKLLAEDLSDIPAPLLEAAAKQWARDERFMPRASELREVARKIQSDSIRGSDMAGQQLHDHCARLNALNGDKHWYVEGQAPNRRVTCRTRVASDPGYREAGR